MIHRLRTDASGSPKITDDELTRLYDRTESTPLVYPTQVQELQINIMLQKQWHILTQSSTLVQ